ncbi:uncharacterized protein STEHIDRAFT_114234 [Stereum hirsutum FP-91666 SS1]|uniref:uncharacterized protein n=1 Tax=Stereum hirsutum (strain FP-91666) TaxID=721885 RepID=UPI0004449817|nr:uncharacterized protein STEHIDRAFT_114234 [Stereum hirsutum FP-91666 SS1]EIM82293.1 hypothetical protein STEHIDRAFT_114234 [Stereum hirsutum FP-91666 SS1]
MKLVLAFLGLVFLTRMTRCTILSCMPPSAAADPDMYEGIVNDRLHAHTRASYRLLLRLRPESSWLRTIPSNVAADADTDTGAEEGALNARAVSAPGYINHPPEEDQPKASPDTLVPRVLRAAYPKNDFEDEGALNSETDTVLALGRGIEASTPDRKKSNSTTRRKAVRTEIVRYRYGTTFR